MNEQTKQDLLAFMADRRFIYSEYPNDLHGHDGGSYNLTDRDRLPFGRIRYRLFTNDGNSWSVQFGSGHYCSGTDENPKSFEVWNCPKHPLLVTETNDGSDPYGYVPIETLVQALTDHGGIMPLDAMAVALRLEGAH